MVAYNEILDLTKNSYVYSAYLHNKSAFIFTLESNCDQGNARWQQKSFFLSYCPNNDNPWHVGTHDDYNGITTCIIGEASSTVLCFNNKEDISMTATNTPAQFKTPPKIYDGSSGLLQSFLFQKTIPM